MGCGKPLFRFIQINIPKSARYGPTSKPCLVSRFRLTKSGSPQAVFLEAVSAAVPPGSVPAPASGLCGFFREPLEPGSRRSGGPAHRTTSCRRSSRETNQLEVFPPFGNLSTVPVSNISEDARTSHPCERGAGLLRQLSNPQEAGVAKISVLTRRTFSLGGV
jgi:hypothetical protein